MRGRSKLIGLVVATLPLPMCSWQYSSAQSTLLLSEKTLQAAVAEASGEIALHNEMMLGPFERIRPEREYTCLFWETEYLLNTLKEYGFSDTHVEQFEASGTQWAAVKGRLTMLSPAMEKLADIDRGSRHCGMWRPRRCGGSRILPGA